MKLYPLSLLLLVPLMALAETKETKTTVYARNVTVITDTTKQAPAACLEAFDRQLDQQGRHEHIYRSMDAAKAVTIVSERDAGGCMLSEPNIVKDVRITLWKAVAQNGKTATEMRVYRLSPTEVNAFIDTELENLVADFESSPVRSS